VNKIKISRIPVVDSPCCMAPSTTTNPVICDAKSNERRCVRCRQVFCRIDVDDSEQPLKTMVGGAGSVT
jgi:hypothetical protein